MSCYLIQDSDTLASFNTEVVFILSVVAVQHDVPGTLFGGLFREHFMGWNLKTILMLRIGLGIGLAFNQPAIAVLEERMDLSSWSVVVVVVGGLLLIAARMATA